MMFSMSLAPDTPEWLLTTATVVFLLLLFGLGGWGLILEIRYISPFTLIQTNNRDKWRKAFILAFLQTVIIPVIGFMAPIVSPLPDQWPFILICGGLWIVALPVAASYKRWEFERHIKNYQRLDKMIKNKNGGYHRLLTNPIMNWTRIFMTADQKRFFSEGFPDEMNQESNVDS